MVKALPASKTSDDYIWCHNEEVWYKRSDCTQEELIAVHPENEQFHSDFDDRTYYTSFVTKYVWKCGNGCWVWDPNDEDVDTPETFHGQMWKCNNCNVLYSEKSDADNCCSEE